RHSAEQRLKNGELNAIVATASLEMGIDVGYIDLVCQVGSPRAIATFLQRVGRSGHSLGLTPKGRLFPLTRDELLECMSLVRAVRQGELDRIEIPNAPLDILAQQIVATVACDEWEEDSLFALCRRAWPYRHLSRKQFDEVVEMLASGMTAGTKRGLHLHRDRINGRVRARRGARLAAITSGGAIPDTAEYRVVTEPEKTFVGTLDEDFAIESMAGDVFLLGNTSWRVQQVRSGEVIVRDAEGAPPSVPFWFGEGPGRTIELSAEVSRLRRDIAATELALREECGVSTWAAEQATNYIESQVAAIGLVPTTEQIVFERFFDESGGMQLVIHSPFGARINRAWGLALRKRFCRSFDFELQAAATDNGIVLSLSPQHSFPIDSLFKMLGPHNAKYLLEQAVLAAPMFQVRWRWNVTRALAVLRRQGGKKVPP
ncbi:MAG: DEAD/DEAH box helicase, partial [Planctomycetales bacterium]|nr:DEAD/DEAH box helicase [Planctomycetales bacterium]